MDILGKELTGIPQLVDMPAPVNTTTFFASARTSATSCSSLGVSALTLVIDMFPLSTRPHSRGNDHLNISVNSAAKSRSYAKGYS